MGVAEDYDSLKKYNIQSIFEAAQKEEGNGSSAPEPKAVSEDKVKEEVAETAVSETVDEVKSE